MPRPDGNHRRSALNTKTPAFILAIALFLSAPLRGQQASALEHLAIASDPLLSLLPQHPRLYLKDDQISIAKHNIETDPLLTAWYNLLQRDAEAMLKEPPAVHVLKGNMVLDHRATGSMVDQSRVSLRRISTLAGLYRLDGDTRKAERARLELLTVADFPDWNPSDFLDTAEMTHAVAIGYDWLFNYLSEQDRIKLRQAIVEKGLREGLAAHSRSSFWTKPERANNWNQVCNASLTIGALAIAESEPDLSRTVILTAKNSIINAMNKFAPDGGWEEGPGYWVYATSYNVFYLAALETALGTDFGLKSSPGFADTGLFRIYTDGPVDQIFNFGDGESDIDTADQMIWLSHEFSRLSYEDHERSIATDSPDIFHLIWGALRPPPSAAILPHYSELPLDAVFRGVNVATFRSKWNDRRALFVGFKGGKNGVSHGHLDLGTFVFDYLGQRWALDLGKDDSNLPGYYLDKRWTYYRTRTEGHNTLVVDGENQNTAASAPIVNFVSGPKRGFAIADLTGAYTPKLTSVLRGVMLLDRRGLLVQDEIDPSEPVEVTWNLHTSALVQTKGDRAVLVQGGERIELRILSPLGAVFKEICACAPLPQAQQPEVKNLTIQLPISEHTRIAVLFGTGNMKAPKLQPLKTWR
jgi:hypothetical protein